MLIQNNHLNDTLENHLIMSIIIICFWFLYIYCIFQNPVIMRYINLVNSWSKQGQNKLWLKFELLVLIGKTF